MRREPATSPWPRLATGLMVVGVGVAFLMDQLGRADWTDVLAWWPAALIVIGLSHLAARAWWQAAAWIVVGTIFLLPLLGLPSISLHDVFGLWPLMITAGGVTLIVLAFRPAPKDLFGSAAPPFRAMAFMGGNERTVGSRDFLGGDVFAVMAGCEIDLTRAEVRGDEVVIDVFAVWGGVELRVPEDWVVVQRAAVIIGSWTDLTRPPANAKKRLVIRGAVIMAGVEIRNG